MGTEKQTAKREAGSVADEVAVIFPDPSRCSGCAVGELCVAAGSDNETLARLDALLRVREPIEPGNIVIRRGDPFRGLVAVRAGCFKSAITDREGREQVLGFHLPGELIGLDAVQSKRHRADVVALGGAAMCMLDYNELLSLSACSRKLQQQLFSLFSGRLADTNWRGTDLSAEERIAGFMLDVSQRLVERGESGEEFELQMSRSDIGNYLGLATETVSRVVRRLHEQGLLDVRRKRVRLTNRPELERLAEALFETR
ncbi:MAG: helix-turn-helix domain-containing protein [Pseudomonadota bacterium]